MALPVPPAGTVGGAENSEMLRAVANLVVMLSPPGARLGTLLGQRPLPPGWTSLAWPSPRTRWVSVC